MPLTKEKYNKEDNTRFEAIANEKEVVEALGELEEIIKKYNLEGKDSKETLRNIEMAVMIGQAGLERIERAIGKKIYFLSAKKRRKAILKGFAGDPQALDMMVISRKGETALLSWNQIYVSRHEAKRAKRNLQIYKLDKDLNKKFFKNEKVKKCYLIEIKKGTDTFMIYQKVFRGYYRPMLQRNFTIDELKNDYDVDIETIYKEKRAKFKMKQAKHL